MYEKTNELRHTRFWRIPRNPISYVNTVDFPHKTELPRAVPPEDVWNLQLFRNGLRVAASDLIRDASTQLR